ncbi:OmpH family outer membrane protein [Pontibacter indicus]|uniref:Periplasmic chaperone for outer membrane proteins Skp n=1 Tax=Pontibacter indicus TaxID=1317125 RepID=A0A1R3XVC9_9BACT|nr:OmpH family outer membrane protein [Pontibacter indicus]SIT95062.1 periplasmic chaperone for outer membrane proteins Skp [Pontibacter indicus]
MKKFLFIFLAGFLLTTVSQAQKFGYIDSNFILSKMPAYAKAQVELDKQSAAWQKEIEGMHQAVDKMKEDYKAEEVLLTEEMKKKRLAEITRKENEVREYQRKVFGFEGMMFKRRQDLIRPIQDEVFTAVEKVAKAKGLQTVFDKSGDLIMIYTNPVHDYTEYVLEELGLATDKQNVPGKQPADALVEDPDSLPETGIQNEESQTQQQEKKKTPPTKKKSNN